MATTSQLATLQAIRTRLLSFSGGVVATALGTLSGAGSDGKLYIDQAPDNVTVPYGVLRIADWRSEGDDGQFARRVEVELQLLTRPRTNASALKGIADHCERAMRAWRDVSSGVLCARQGLTRATVLYEEPADREVVLERLLIPLYVHPTYTTQDSA